MNEAAAVSPHFMYATCVRLDSRTFGKHERALKDRPAKEIGHPLD